MPKKPWPTLGQRIREARQRMGWTQTELAVAVRSTQDHVSDLERDRHAPSMGMLRRLAAALQIEPADLLQERSDAM